MVGHRQGGLLGWVPVLKHGLCDQGPPQKWSILREFSEFRPGPGRPSKGVEQVGAQQVVPASSGTQLCACHSGVTASGPPLRVWLWVGSGVWLDVWGRALGAGCW